MKIAVISTGTWGLALSNLLSDKGHAVTAYTPFAKEKEALSLHYRHPRFPGVALNRSIAFSDDLGQTLADAAVVVFATPSPYLRGMARNAKGLLASASLVVSVTKGLEDDTFLTMSEVIEEELGNTEVTVLSGPTHAEEVVRKMPTLCVASSNRAEDARKVRDLFSNEYFRVYDSHDPYGVELCGALKNVIALGAGIAEGLGYGDNCKAAIITRGLVEIVRLSTAMGADRKTFYGLAGLGDLVVTATSRNSRNHECGVYIGQGYGVGEARNKVGMEVEGLNALKAAYHLSRRKGVEMPIVEAVYDVVYGGLDPVKAVENLFSRSLKEED